MRVTKTIESYIRKEVKARVEPKYAAEKAELHRIFEARDAFEHKCRNAAMDAFWTCYEENFHEVKDFCKLYRNIKPGDDIIMSSILMTSFQGDYEDVFHWQDRMRDEVNDIVENIIVELELGGNKNRLMELLNQI